MTFLSSSLIFFTDSIAFSKALDIEVYKSIASIKERSSSIIEQEKRIFKLTHCNDFSVNKVERTGEEVLIKASYLEIVEII